MKSIMEEASSIAKAIENGWAKAGKPKEFSIKIFEHPEKNFFGLTTKNAKIAIIFDEKVDYSHQESPAKKTTKPQIKKQQAPARNPKPELRKPQQEPEIRKTQSQEAETEAAEWTSEMIAFANDWFKDVLVSLERNDLKFSTDIEKGQLLITLENPIFDNNEQNKRLARPLSQLLVQTLRNHLKKPLRGYRVTIKTQA